MRKPGLFPSAAALALSVSALCSASDAASAAGLDAFKGTTTYDSFYGNSGDPFEGHAWSNAQGGEAWVMREFDRPVILNKISIQAAGTDVTPDNSLIRVEVKDKGGRWHSVFELSDAVINRDFSANAPVIKVGPQIIEFPNVTVRAVRLFMKGHGWFTAQNIRFNGE